jgi:hypothetical protein
MGWRLVVPGLPDGYEVVEHEDGLSLIGPGERRVAEFGPMVAGMGVVVSAAWEDVQQKRISRLQPVG